MLGLNFKVKRERYSTTQGEAVVYFDHQEVGRFQDRIELVDGKWTSTYSDESFIQGILNHPFEEVYEVSKPLKTYLLQNYPIQKVSKDEICALFDSYLAHVNHSASIPFPPAPEGMYYTQLTNQFIGFKTKNGTSDAQEFETEAETLCWLVAN